MLKATKLGTSRTVGDGTVVEAAENKLEQLTTAQEVLAQRVANRQTQGKDPDKTQINPAETEAVLQSLKRQGYGVAFAVKV